MPFSTKMRCIPWSAVIAGLLVTAGLVVWQEDEAFAPAVRANEPAPVVIDPNERDPALQAEAKRDRVTFRWDKLAVEQAEHAVLTVTEGQRTTVVHLTPSQLATGSFEFLPAGRSLAARFAVQQNGRAAGTSELKVEMPAAAPAKRKPARNKRVAKPRPAQVKSLRPARRAAVEDEDEDEQSGDEAEAAPRRATTKAKQSAWRRIWPFRRNP